MIERKAAHYLILVLTIALSAASAASQTTTQYDKGTPPQHATGVSSLGSYTTTELGTVNLSNGSLNIKIPLGTVGGRGFSIPLTLNYSSKVWSASMDTDTDWAGQEHPVAYADYDRGGDWAGWGNFIGAGWSIGAVPIMNSRRVQIQRITGGPCNGGYAYLLTKFTLKMPDGGEVEFRDDLYDGAPLPATGCGSSAPSRGVRWHASDGSGTIFVKDVAEPDGLAFYDTSGVVITRDGTRYRFNGSWCASITDRNGNKITIEQPSGLEVRYTDQLGRITSVKQNVADPDNPSITLAVLVTFPGYQGQPRYFKIKSGVMNQNYRSDIAPTLPVITGDWDPQSKGFAWPAGTTRLFDKSYGMYAYQIDDLNVLTEVVLPDSRFLSFRYNQFGEVAEVMLPTGGKIQYDYGYASSLPSGNSPVWETGTGGVGGGIRTDVKFVDRAVTESRTYPDGATLEGKWSYIYGPQVVNGTSRPCTQIQARSNTDTLLLDQRNFFLDAGRFTEPYQTSGNHDGTQYSLWSTGVEWRSETRDAVGNVIAASEQDWAQRAPISWSTYTSEQISNDNRVSQQRRYLDTGAMAKTETDYDQYNNPTEVREYDYDQTLKRRTTTTYLTTNIGFNYATDDSIHLLSLPATITVFNSAGTQIAQTSNEYDVYSDDGNRYLLTDYGTVSQHDSSYGTLKKTRGNPTRVGQWLNTTSSFIYSYPRFDTLGNVVSTKDANGNITTFSFADDFGLGTNPGTATQNPSTPTYAFLTQITSPPPLPGAPVHTAQSEYDYSTGLLTGFRDRNSMVTQTIYNDPFNRPTQVKSALGVSGVEAHTTNYYAPATVLGLTLTKNDVLTVSDLNTLDDASIRGWTVTDGFGRTTEAWKRDPQGDVKVATIYDALGRVKQVSNPFRPSAGEAAIYSTTVYDFASRVQSVTTADNAVVNTAYAGNTVTVTDQAGKARKSVTDALGRLVEVDEDPSGLNYQTTYTYDVLDNLAKVTQGTQQRFFMYDSLKRLIRARNPEQSTNSSLTLTDPLTSNSTWSTGYQYDPAGNLLVKTDARGVSTHFEYDAFNRNTRRWYNGSSSTSSTTHNNPVLPSGVGATDETKFYYDTQTLPSGAPSYSRGSAVGRLVAQVYGTGSNGDYFAYDVLGRQTLKYQQLGAVNYQLSAVYNLAGGIKTLTYPSIHTVTNTYDSAGRLTDLSGNLGDSTVRTYATGILYSPFGGLTKEQFGTTPTSVYNKLFYNSRGQLSEIRVSTGYTGPTDTTWNRGAIINHYSEQCWGMCGGNNSTSPMTDNNGNLKKQEVYIPNDDQVSGYTQRWQQYDYDSLNRLNWVREIKDNVEQWKQQFIYDRWGNRTINTGVTYGVGINNKAFTVDTGTNRLTVPVGQSGTMTYDAAGNLTNDTYTGAGNRTYDGENKITSATGSSTQTEVYAYDASGQRIKRTVDGVTTWQVYGLGGELLAEYAANGAANTPQKEYGYRNGQLLVTAEPASGPQNVIWTNATGVSISGNSLTKTAADDWSNARAASTQSLTSGDGYVEFTASETNTYRMVGLGEYGTGSFTYSNLRYMFYVAASGTLYADEYGSLTNVGTYATGDTLRVGIEAGIVKYRKNGTVVYTSPLAPVYPLYADATLYTNGSTLSNVKFSSAGSGAKVQWLISDQLGTPRMILDQTGSLANMKRHDYLPFGEELFAPTSGRTAAQGYANGDGIRQQFTQKERDVETGLDYFVARYYTSVQGRFISPDDFTGGPKELYNFADIASSNPTFYADLTTPQSLNKYQYGFNNPLKYVDPDGHDALYVENKDTGEKTLIIPVNFTGANASAGLISEVVERAAKLDTGDSGVKIQVVATDKPINGVLNNMDLSQGTDYKHYWAGEGVNKVGGNTGHVNTNGVGQGGAVVHELMHMAGIKDRYVEKYTSNPKNRKAVKPERGYEDSNIMATNGGTKLKANQIQEARKNKTTKKCTVENGITKCK